MRRWNWNPTTDWTVKQGLVFEKPSKGSYNGDAAEFSYLQPFTFSAWIKPTSPDGAILTRLDDYIESQGHGLYLMNGKVRLHLTHRFTDLGLRVETVEPVKLNEWQHVVATYDGKRLASGVRIYINGEARETKILFDQNTEPFQKKHTDIRVGEGGGLKFDGEISDARIYKRALTPRGSSRGFGPRTHRETRRRFRSARKLSRRSWTSHTWTLPRPEKFNKP